MPRPASTAANSTWNYNDPETFQNQVSRDGSTLFFVSPEAGDPRELYVRRNGHSTLVSHAADGSAASSGVVPVGTANTVTSAGSYAYGSVDGKAAIFWSVDSLAPGAPADSMAKAYRYDVETDTVTYLPGIGGRINVGRLVKASIVAASDDDRRFLFTEDVGGTFFEGIYVWDEGTIKTIYSGLIRHLAPARATASGSAFVFSTSTFDQFLGFNSGPPFTNQIYRYDVAKEKLSCVSCPPDDVVPSGNAILSNQDASNAGVANPTGSVAPSRGFSEDGNHVFFDTPDPLVPRDTNGTRDVYEWTPTRISLISSGHDSQPSFFLDSSADGSDVFFATKEGLDADDADGSYDVYDAHVDGGFLRREVTPCSGEECRSSASVPAGAQTAASKSFAGAGNQPQQKPKKKTHKKKHHKKKAHKRNAGHNRGGSK